jgi:hypothetical protein
MFGNSRPTLFVHDLRGSDSLPPRPALAQKLLVSIRALFPNASKVTLEVNSSLIANLQLSRLTFRIRSVNHVDSK